MAAATMIAVPCWSSWNTGMRMRARSLASTSKHSGALMSSRLIAPKVGSSAATISTSLSGSRSSISMSNASMPANFLNRTALPSITGLAASGPIAPRPSTAVPLLITADEIAARGQRRGFARIVGDALAGRRHARRIGERQVALIGQRLGRDHRELAGRLRAVVVERGFAQRIRHGCATPRRCRCLRGRSHRHAARNPSRQAGLTSDEPSGKLRVAARSAAAHVQCAADRFCSEVVRPRRLELPPRFQDSALNAARLPIPPRPRICERRIAARRVALGR